MGFLAIQAGADQTFVGSTARRERRGWWGQPKCPKADYEIFDNADFLCGTQYWDTNSYGGIITDNGDGTITFTAEQAYSSLTQLDKLPLPQKRYHFEVNVLSVTGNGKIAYKVNGTWNTVQTFTDAGSYHVDIDPSGDIEAIDIGAHGDDTFEAVFSKISCIDVTLIPAAEWWKIASLKPSDILGVWDMTWLGNFTQEDVLRNMEGSMPDMTVDAGNPIFVNHEEGMNFGGAGSIKSLLPDGLDMRDLTVIMEFHKTTQNGTLDAFYSHFTSTSSGRYTLQNGWGSSVYRWSCGDGTASTIEIPGLRLEGVSCTAGREVYFNGEHIGTVPDSGESSSLGTEFRFGCILANDSRTQFVKTRLKKLLLVGRQLNRLEQLEIYSRITGTPFNPPIDNIVHNSDNVVHGTDNVVAYQ